MVELKNYQARLAPLKKIQDAIWEGKFTMKELSMIPENQISSLSKNYKSTPRTRPGSGSLNSTVWAIHDPKIGTIDKTTGSSIKFTGKTPGVCFITARPGQGKQTADHAVEVK